MSVVRYLRLAALKYLPFFTLFALLPQQVIANVIIHGTRVIYPQNQREVNIQLSNDSDKPALIQTWIDNGDEQITLDKTSIPFVLTPPIVRIEPNSGQTLRLTWTGAPLPQDRESIFWLNILDIPPKSTNPDDVNILQMAIRSRMKIFFRPQALSADGATKAFHTLQWERSPSAPRTLLKVSNPSGYFINISSIKIDSNGKEIKSTQSEMIAPKSATEFRFTALPEKIHDTELRYEVINDYGSITTIKPRRQDR